MTTPIMDRVTRNTADGINQRIQRQLEMDLAYCARHPDAIVGRLAELDREWDIERVIQAEAPLTSLVGLGLGLGADRRLLAIPLFAQAMLLLHATQGWYPLLPLLRRLGIRTRQEIERERLALTALFGASDGQGPRSRPDQS